MTQKELNEGQLVYVIHKDIFVRIEDKECVNNMMIYYTSDKSSYLINQLYFIDNNQKNETKLNKEISSVIDEWLTPDKCLELSVKIKKRLNKPFIIKEQDLRAP